MENIEGKKLVRACSRGFEIYNLDDMQKIIIERREVNQLFLQQIKSEDSRKFDGLRLDDMEKIEQMFFHHRASILKGYIEDNAWRITLASEGEEYVNKYKNQLKEYIKKYRELFSEKTNLEIKLEKDKKIVIVDMDYNISVIDED